MNIEDLEENLSDFLPAGFRIERNRRGEVVIYTGLRQDDDGDLVDIRASEDESDSDLDMDADFEPLDDEEMDEES